MKYMKKLFVLLLAVLLINSMIIPCFASVVPATTEAKVGETVTVTFNYDNIAGIRGTLSVSGDDIVDSIAVEVGNGFEGIYSETNRILAYFAAKPADFTFKLIVKLKDTAVAGNECKIDFQYETTVDGKMSSTPNYQYESATITIVVDFDELNRQITIAESLHKESYTEESWKVLQDALEKAIEARKSTSQTEVDGAAKALRDAIAALVLKPNAIDYVELNRQIAIAESFTKDDYTIDSWNDVADALEEAIKARNSTSQAEVDAAAKALKDAIASLELKPVVDYTELNRQITIAQALKQNDYTAESWKTLQDALEEAIKARNSTSQTEVDAATKALKDAIEALELAPGAVDYVELNRQITIAEGLKENDYTADSWKVLQDALKKAIEARNSTSQTEVDAAAKALKDAIDALESAPVVDYTELNRQITIAEGLKEKDYTKHSWKVLTDALKKAIEARNSTSQTEVDEAEKALRDAIEALEFKNADSPVNGDNSVVIPVVIVAIVSAIILVVLLRKKKTEETQD